MRRLRWAVDSGGVWDLDMEAPVTMEGTARPVPGHSLPLGLSRGPRLSRPKQLDFMHRFMSAPLVPSYSGDTANGGHGLDLHHVDTFHFGESWTATMIQKYRWQKIVSLVKDGASNGLGGIPWIKNFAWNLLDACCMGYGSEFLITPDSSLLVETYNDGREGKRNKAVFHTKLAQHNLTLEAAWPGLFVDKLGNYWDVPSLMTVDFASIASDSGASYHLCLQHNGGEPKSFSSIQTSEIPPTLLPGWCAKAAFALKKNVDIWRKKEGKLKMVQPYDMFLSDPHISTSGIIGSVVSAYFGDKSMRLCAEDDYRSLKSFIVHPRTKKAALFADLFASIACTVQHGNFQRFFLDLTRLNARVDFPSGSAFIAGVAQVAQDYYNSRKPNFEAVRALSPNVSLSLQQQIAGPFSLRVESRFTFNSENKDQFPHIDESVFAIEYALQVLGSAKATAWYSPKRQEAMVELRFFES